ncbi:MAG TPA: hypothetical protein VHJ38_00250 [Nitrososphaeraceae archaeon]|jgi:hypothetical protein|nr:hypothetical protein [Nitrososphaeraceae archaeon]HSE99349.1 hypothetical protein [Nitrososphaeraceae archaeon]
MEDCICNKNDKAKDLLLDIFIVSSHLTILRCIKCGGLIGEWIDKITPIKRSYSKVEQEILK